MTMVTYTRHTPPHAYRYKIVIRSSRLLRRFLFLKHSSRLMIWGCLSIVSKVSRSKYCCRRYTIQGYIGFYAYFVAFLARKRRFGLNIFYFKRKWIASKHKTYKWLSRSFTKAQVYFCAEFITIFKYKPEK